MLPRLLAHMHLPPPLTTSSPTHTPPLPAPLSLYLSLTHTHTLNFGSVPHVVTMCVLCCGGGGSSLSVKRGSGAVSPRGAGSLGGMFILSTAFDVLLLITSCTLYMNAAAPGGCIAGYVGDTGCISMTVLFTKTAILAIFRPSTN